MHVRVMCLCHACTVVHVVPFRAWGQRVSESLGRGRPRAAPLQLCTSMYKKGLGAQGAEFHLTEQEGTRDSNQPLQGNDEDDTAIAYLPSDVSLASRAPLSTSRPASTSQMNLSNSASQCRGQAKSVENTPTCAPRASQEEGSVTLLRHDTKKRPRPTHHAGTAE